MATAPRNPSPRNSSRGTSTPPIFPTLIFLSAPVAKCASAIFFSGKLPTPKSSSPKLSGLISIAPASSRRSSTSKNANVATGASTPPSPPPANPFLSLFRLCKNRFLTRSANSSAGFPRCFPRVSAPCVMNSSLIPAIISSHYCSQLCPTLRALFRGHFFDDVETRSHCPGSHSGSRLHRSLHSYGHRRHRHRHHHHPRPLGILLSRRSHRPPRLSTLDHSHRFDSSPHAVALHAPAAANSGRQAVTLLLHGLSQSLESDWN